jgi:hypothetical protein
MRNLFAPALRRIAQIRLASQEEFDCAMALQAISGETQSLGCALQTTIGSHPRCLNAAILRGRDIKQVVLQIDFVAYADETAWSVGSLLKRDPNPYLRKVAG